MDGVQICCSTKLLAEMGLNPRKVPAESDEFAPLSNWYADLFRWNRRKVLVFYHPATGYGGAAVNIGRSEAKNIAVVLREVVTRGMEADGFSREAIEKVVDGLDRPTIARNGSHRDRAFMVKAVNDLGYRLGRVVQTDRSALEDAAHRSITHGIGGPHGNPVGAFGELLGEEVRRRRFWDAPQDDVSQVLVSVDGISPRIWRRLMVPSAMPLDRFHLVLQGAFGWTVSHLHSFQVGDTVFEDPSLSDG